MTSIFLMKITIILPPKIFKVFFNRKMIFVFKQTFFEKKTCLQVLIFCVYNVVLDILILDFFLFFFITVSKTLKTPLSLV